MAIRWKWWPIGPRRYGPLSEGLVPAAFHNTAQYANNRVECDHGRLKARLRPVRGFKLDHSARVIMRPCADEEHPLRVLRTALLH